MATEQKQQPSLTTIGCEQAHKWINSLLELQDGTIVTCGHPPLVKHWSSSGQLLATFEFAPSPPRPYHNGVVYNKQALVELEDNRVGCLYQLLEDDDPYDLPNEKPHLAMFDLETKQLVSTVALPGASRVIKLKSLKNTLVSFYLYSPRPSLWSVDGSTVSSLSCVWNDMHPNWTYGNVTSVCEIGSTSGLLVCGTKGTTLVLSLWDTPQDCEAKKFVARTVRALGKEQLVKDVVAVDDSRCVTLGTSGICMWDVQSGECLWVIAITCDDLGYLDDECGISEIITIMSIPTIGPLTQKPGYWLCTDRLERWNVDNSSTLPSSLPSSTSSFSLSHIKQLKNNTFIVVDCGAFAIIRFTDRLVDCCCHSLVKQYEGKLGQLQVVLPQELWELCQTHHQTKRIRSLLA
eukprot:TRINITY_DN1056_c0_g1_i2.p1 TRINITY_DN1056_c0_g1~~TRINITY_DN1056_c0_g1_i2.p1  ORF type:complete len:421 (+),score=73.01 TRINITY_DN1056_c0_g1_i2:50-1264(+)